MTEPSHGEILRAIGVMEGKLEQLLAISADQSRERSSLGERVGRLESRMAQVVIVAVVAAMVSPMVWNEVSDWLHRQPMPAQQHQQP
jgi:hypothetical protein